MDAYLVSAPRYRLQLQQGEAPRQRRGRAVQRLAHAVLRLRLATAGHHRHLLAVAGVPADGRLDCALGRLRHALYQRQVGLMHLSFLELMGQAGPGPLAPGDDQEPRGVLVQTMDDPRPHRVPRLCQLRRDGQQGVHQRAAGVPRRRVYGEPRRFVHDDDVFVLVDDGERDELRRRFRLLHGRQCRRDTRAGGQVVGGALPPAVHRHQPLVDEATSVAAGQDVHAAGQEDVQPLAGPIGRQIQRLHVRLLAAGAQ